MLEKPIHMTWSEARSKYPNMWVFMINTVFNGADPVEGDVVAAVITEEEDDTFVQVHETYGAFFVDSTYTEERGNFLWPI